MRSIYKSVAAPLKGRRGATVTCNQGRRSLVRLIALAQWNEWDVAGISYGPIAAVVKIVTAHCHIATKSGGSLLVFGGFGTVAYPAHLSEWQGRL